MSDIRRLPLAGSARHSAASQLYIWRLALLADLGRGDLVQVDLPACDRAALLAPDLFWSSGSALRPRSSISNRGSGAAGKDRGAEPSCSSSGSDRAGEPDWPLRWRRTRRDRGPSVAKALRATDRVSYRNTAEANKPTASQTTAHSPNDRNNTAVIDTRSDQ
jgi:hypothetical protein